MPTHEVFNVPSPWTGVNLFADDRALSGALAEAGADAEELELLRRLGELAGTPLAQEWGRLANSHPPVLRTHDRYGHRIDEVEFHPSWHELMAVAVSNGLQAAPWAPGATKHAHLSRAAGFYVWSQVEQGHLCPISMSYAVLPTLRHSPELAARYEPGLLSDAYDFGLRPARAKRGLLAGMAMTEKQGGSDVHANTTRAVGQPDGSYRLTGHKWFCSAPMCDLFLVLAQTEEGLGCFAVPRVLPDGTRNPFALQRLKDKLGNRSNASSEVEFDGTVGWLVGEPGRGVRTIIDMVAMTRLDCVIGSAGLQRAALTQALHHVAGRSAFGARLADQPLMRAVLADLAVEVDAAMQLSLRLAGAVDRGETALLRLGVAAAKFWVCKRTSTVVGESLECLGGAGYVEESPLPRYYRESPLNSIWEGSGNVIALDVLRALGREPATLEVLTDELAGTTGADPRLDAAVAQLTDLLRMASTDPAAAARQARTLTGLLARTLQASLLVRAAEGPEPARAAIAEAFLASRLAAEPPAVFGTGPLAAGLGDQIVGYTDPNAA
ncbi:MAG TPA: acyl-CoA dehydrogenase family protein [Jatrophihabitans sp.]|nr:acyl-CoA dehydrogenase family protein [Jatrophihabitans sp.]